MTESFVYDTYALMEIINKNKNYEKYLDGDVIINTFIFAEYCYNLIKNNVKERNFLIEEIKTGLRSVNPKLIEDAMKFRHKNKKRKLSMVDCISYLQAENLGVKFLTGDKRFENMENVEFVK